MYFKIKLILITILLLINNSAFSNEWGWTFYQNGEPIHFAQSDVNDDGSYEYKFRIRSVDGDTVVDVFEGDYVVKIFKTVNPTSDFSI